MSWLTKVTDLAGKAEEMLNKLDQTTSDVIQKQKRTSASSSRSNLAPTSSAFTREGLYEGGVSHESGVHHTRSERGGLNENVQRKQLGSVSRSVTGVPREEDAFAILLEPEHGRSRRSSSTSLKTTATEEEVVEAPSGAAISTLRAQLQAKESQLTILRLKLQECEQQLDRRLAESTGLRLENQKLRSQQQSTSGDAAKELEATKEALSKAQKEVSSVRSSEIELKNRLTAQNEEVREIGNQLRLAKYNLTANKTEFDDYKEKAQKILAIKERLIEELKQGGGDADRDDSTAAAASARLQEVIAERDLARTELESLNVTVYNLRSELEELESRQRAAEADWTRERQAAITDRQRAEAEQTALREQLDAAQIESSFARNELKRRAEEHATQLLERDVQLQRYADESRRREIYATDVSGAEESRALATRLLEKQTECESLRRELAVLRLRIERATRDSTVVDVEQQQHHHSTPRRAANVTPSSMDDGPGVSPIVDTVAKGLHRAALKLAGALRAYPHARILFSLYFLLIHLWVFFVLVTYTPEIHTDHGALSGPGSAAAPPIGVVQAAGLQPPAPPAS